MISEPVAVLTYRRKAPFLMSKSCRLGGEYRISQIKLDQNGIDAPFPNDSSILGASETDAKLLLLASCTQERTSARNFGHFSSGCPQRAGSVLRRSAGIWGSLMSGGL